MLGYDHIASSAGSYGATIAGRFAKQCCESRPNTRDIGGLPDQFLQFGLQTIVKAQYQAAIFDQRVGLHLDSRVKL